MAKKILINKPKVLVITSIYPNNIEPHSGKFNEQQISMLRDFEVRVLAPVPWFPFIGLFGRWAEFSQANQVDRIEERNGIIVYHPRYFVIPKIARCLYGFLYMLSILGLMIRINREFKFDAIYGTWAYPDGFASVLLSRIFGKPIVLKTQGSDINDYTKYFLRRRLILYALKNAGKVISVSDALRRKMINMGVPSGKIKVIYNGVNHDMFMPMDMALARKKLNIPLNKKVVLFIGTLKPVKGLNYLIDAFHKLSSEIHDLMLIIIGGGVEERSIREKTQKYGLEKRVIMVGVKEHKEIPTWINACDLFCLSSLSEGVPNVILEALSTGTPAVATDVGGVSEAITSREYGILVNSKDSSALARAIKDGLESEWDSSSLSEYAKGFSWENNTRLLAREIFHLIQNRSKHHSYCQEFDKIIPDDGDIKEVCNLER